jgi:hypothetical protein
MKNKNLQICLSTKNRAGIQPYATSIEPNVAQNFSIVLNWVFVEIFLFYIGAKINWKFHMLEE